MQMCSTSQRVTSRAVRDAPMRPRATSTPVPRLPTTPIAPTLPLRLRIVKATVSTTTMATACVTRRKCLAAPMRMRPTTTPWRRKTTGHVISPTKADARCPLPATSIRKRTSSSQEAAILSLASATSKTTRATTPSPATSKRKAIVTSRAVWSSDAPTPAPATSTQRPTRQTVHVSM